MIRDPEEYNALKKQKKEALILHAEHLGERVRKAESELSQLKGQMITLKRLHEEALVQGKRETWKDVCIYLLDRFVKN